MKIAIYSPYLDTLGGGERYILTIAEHLSKNHEVVIFWDGKEIKTSVKERLNIDLSKVKFQKTQKAIGYDAQFYVSDGSIPVGYSKKNILHFQVPFLKTPNIPNSLKLLTWQKVIVNSNFTKKIIDKSYRVTSTVLYPPVDIKSLRESLPRPGKNIILSVGRFFSPLHDKKQDVLIEAFKKMNLKNWKLILGGGVDESAKTKLDDLKKNLNGFPIEIKENIDFKSLSNLYGEAKIYWHAAGFGENEIKTPEKVEHFGISTVEAMAAGAVPIVVPYGGQKEIVDDNQNGLYYSSEDELINKTKSLAGDNDLLNKLSKNAEEKSKIYSKEKFCQKIDEIIS